MDHLQRKFCRSCGVEFWAPKAVFDECERAGAKRSYYCVNGHGFYFATTTEQRLEREKAELKRSIDFREEELRTYRHRVRSLLGLVTKLKRKVAAHD